MATAVPLRREYVDGTYYPSSDGKPMAETEAHRDETINCIEALKGRYASHPDVQVSGDNFIYYVEGDRRKVVSPDVYVVFGVEKRLRDSYFVWREGGRTPSVVFEFTSPKTQREDTGKKMCLYAQELRVPECFLFDVKGEYLTPPLQGYRLVDGVYLPMEPVNGRLYSGQLGLELVAEQSRLRLYDPERGEWLLTPAENRVRAEMEARRAEAEANARREAEAENKRLRAELEALRRQCEER
jgi:Uma2 family endonuclease